MPMGEDPRHGILAALVVALVGLLLLIVAAFAVAPVLVIVLGVMTYVVWWYVSKEGTSYLHHAQEHENRFWTSVAFCFSGALVFVYDSPVALGQWSPVLGFVFVTLFTYTVHSLDRQFHRSRIGRAPFQFSVESSVMLHGSVQDKCRRISVCLSKLDNRLVATNLNHMLWADMVQNLEKEIVGILSDANPEELNYMLPKVGLGLLFYKIKDHSPINLHRTSLLDLLAVTRISDLNVTSRALVLDALQQMKLSAHRKSELYARNVILKTKGDNLSELKSLTDAKGDFHSIHKLVYQDIKDTTIREEVLKHIATQAMIQEAHMRLGTRTGNRRSGKAWRKILSDVDDTLTCSGGRYPAGVDKRYPRKSVYPGVLDFYRELDLGVNGPTEWPSDQLGNLVFLSARPHVYKDMSESHSYAKFRRLQDEKDLYCCPTLLAGDIDTGTTMMITGNVEPVAEKKFQNFAEYASIYPEFKHVFVGDNGQGDVRAAEMMAEKFPHLLEAIYMHRVVPEEKTFGYQGAETRKCWKKANIMFFGDYVEAACHAYKRGLIQAVGLQRVCQGAVQQFVDMKFENPLDRELQRRQINQSLWKANKLLLEAHLEPNWLIRAVRAFDDMDAVLTRFGVGFVVGFRAEDGVYEVLINWPERGSSKDVAVAIAAAAAAATAVTASAAATGTGTEAAPRANKINPNSATAQSPPMHTRRPHSTSPQSHSLTPRQHVTQPRRSTSFTDATVARGRTPTPTSISTSTVTSSRVTARSSTSTPAVSTAVAVVPQRGPDAAGGGEVVAGNGSNRTAVTPSGSVGGGAPMRRHDDGALVLASASGAEEAGGGPTPLVIPNMSPGQRERVDEGRWRMLQQADAVDGDVTPKREGSEVREGRGRHQSLEGSRGRAAARAWAPDDTEQSSATDTEGFGTRTMSPVDEEDASGSPYAGVAAAAAAKAFASSKTRGAMLVRAYLQLPDLKKAPPETKKAYYRDDSDEVKSIRRANPLSIFRSGQDTGGGTVSTRSPAKPVIKGFPKGTTVRTFMGPAIVNKFRSEDGMCEVSFHGWTLSRGKKPVFAILRAADLTAEPTVSATAVAKSPSLLGRTGMAISSLFKLSAEHSSTVDPPEPRVGDIVNTIFGPAAVTCVRGGSSRKLEFSRGSKARAKARLSDGRLNTGSSRGTHRVNSSASGSQDGKRSSSDGLEFSSSSSPTSVSGSCGEPETVLREGEGFTSSPEEYHDDAEPVPRMKRPRSNSATAAVSAAGVGTVREASNLFTKDDGGLQLSSPGAGVLLPGKLYSPPSTKGQRRSSRASRPSLPLSPDAADVGKGDIRLLSPPVGNGKEGDSGDSEGSPLGVKILERGRGPSSTEEVMYEVMFMKWRLGDNTPAKAVLNRGSIWAEWEARPRYSAPGSRRSRGEKGHKKQSSRSSSSFFGFMSMVGGLGGGGNAAGEGHSISSLPGSPKGQKTSKPSTVPVVATVTPVTPAEMVPLPVHPCEFPLGACVKTARFGPALVVKFRPLDGIYQVSILGWRLGGGTLAVAYLHGSAIEAAIAVPGMAVRTIMGLGTVELVREDGVIVVLSRAIDGGSTMSPSSNRPAACRPRHGEIMMFLQPSGIVKAARATVGDRVSTSFGSGVVRCYSSASDTYTIDLGWGVLHTPHGSAILERKTAAISTTMMNARSSSGIIKLFRWPLFGSGISSTMLPPSV